MPDEERRMATTADAYLDLEQGNVSFIVSRDRRNGSFVCEIDVVNVPSSAAPTWRVFESVFSSAPAAARRYQEPVRVWRIVRDGRVTTLAVADRLKPRGYSPFPSPIPVEGFTIYVDSTLADE